MASGKSTFVSPGHDHAAFHEGKPITMKTAFALVCGVLLLGSCSPAQDSPSEKGTADDTLPNEKFLMGLWQGGVDFYARGNEPSWALDIDFDSDIRFRTPGGLAMDAAAVGAVETRDADVTRYTAETDSGSLAITIRAAKCTDTMSGEVFTHRVRLEVRSAPEGEVKRFEGCGRYVPDYGLNDIWVLTHLDGEAVDGSDLPRGLPTMELHTRDNRVLGHGGCNSIMGGFAVEWNVIRFGEIVTTMMACPDMRVETDFLRAISGKSLAYRREGLTLLLLAEDGTELRFKKVD